MKAEFLGTATHDPSSTTTWEPNLVTTPLGPCEPGRKVKFVPTGNPNQDLSEKPLIIAKTGDLARIGLVVEFESTADNIYGAEIHFKIEPRGIVRVVDAWPESHGIQLATSGDNPRLALTGLERLRFTIDGFPDNGDDVRSCVGDPVGKTGDDSIYTFIKGATGDNTNIQLQKLDQHKRKLEWGDNWCGPTAAGISLTWFAETNPKSFGSLIPHVGSVITTADKYAAIGKLGAFMQTDSGDGTTDNDLVDGIVEYINDAGLTGDFVVKVYNHPIPFSYRHELAQGEDVLVGISYEDGSGGHWLVGRSFSNIINDAGTPATADDYWDVSFIDPYTASVYHTRMWGSYIQYNGQRVRVDILIAVSPKRAACKDNYPLAAAVAAANSGDTIKIPCGTTTLSTELVIDGKTLTIIGAGRGQTIIQAATQAGVANHRVMTISGNRDVAIRGVTIQFGNSSAGQHGGGIFHDSTGTLSLTGVAVISNTSGENGGGIFTRGTLNLTDTVVNDNNADGAIGGGGIYHDSTSSTASNITKSGIIGNTASSAHGGGIFNLGPLTIWGSKVQDNAAAGSTGIGGGIYNQSVLNVTKSIVDDNTASRGGGIFHEAGTLNLDDVTVSGGSATNQGGGIWTGNGGVSNITDSTISNNTAGGSSGGGGIFNKSALNLEREHRQRQLRYRG